MAERRAPGNEPNPVDQRLGAIRSKPAQYGRTGRQRFIAARRNRILRFRPNPSMIYRGFESREISAKKRG